MNRKKLLATIIAAILILTMIMPVIANIAASAVSQSEIDALKQQQADIQGKKNDMASQIKDLQDQQATAMEQKAALDHQNELTRQEIELVNEQIELYAQLILKKEKELEEAVAAEELQTQRYRERLRAMEENGEYNYIEIIFNASSFSDLLARIDFITEIAQYDSQLEKALKAAKENVASVKADYEQTKLEEEAAKKELLAKKAELEHEIEIAYLMILEIEKNITEHEEEYAAMEADEAAVQAQIADMIAELQRQEAEAAAAAQQSGGGGGGSVVGTGSYIWPLPSNKYVSSGFGYRIHPIFQTNRFHSGIDIGGTSGASIVAADSGTVAIAQFSSSYGNYVVINHGSGNTTLYAHMSSMAVSVGQYVNQGDTIGYVGSTGWSTGPHLHYEITAGGVRVDPLLYYTDYIKGF